MGLYIFLLFSKWILCLATVFSAAGYSRCCPDRNLIQSVDRWGPDPLRWWIDRWYLPSFHPAVKGEGGILYLLKKIVW